MARIRSVKPELRRDLTVAEWPREVRYAWVLMFGYLDDYGRGLDDMRLLVADLFPLDRDVTERKLDGWLDIMATDSLHGTAPLCRYEVRGRRYLHAPKWSKSQRVSHPQDSKCPPCPMHDLDGNRTGTAPEPFRSEDGTAPTGFRTSRAPADLGSKGAREQGSKGAREAAETAEFETWWLAYPRKEGKGAARKAWPKARDAASLDELLAAASRFRSDPNRQDKYTPHAATWLNGERWTDEPLPAGGSQPPVVNYPDADYADHWGNPA